jgi:Ca2+-binding EF-hand superfamily protein
MQLEKTMRKTAKYALAFAAIAGALSTSAIAAEESGRRGGQNLIQRADADKSGDITFEEFAAAMDDRFANADANNDGKMTVGEVADQIERMRAERMARRLIQRFDTNGDGELTKAEIEARQKKRFALLDRNDDGKIAEDELPRRGERRGWRRH